MTYWADNIKFIKDVLDSKYKKIEDSLADVSDIYSILFNISIIDVWTWNIQYHMSMQKWPTFVYIFMLSI